ncbi:MAG: Flp family type IVb pilin [Gammaproteobacteria bacterium]|jgi:pilus assembly protein Flp/PilA
MAQIILRLFKDDSGVTAIEYSLIAASIAVVLIGVLTNVYTALNGIYFTIVAALAG